MRQIFVIIIHILLLSFIFKDGSVLGQELTTTPRPLLNLEDNVSKSGITFRPTPTVGTPSSRNMTRPRPPTSSPQSMPGMFQSLQKRLDLLNTTLVSLGISITSKNLVNISNNVGNNTKQIAVLTASSRKFDKFQVQLGNLSSRIDNLEGSLTSAVASAVASSSMSMLPSETRFEKRLTSLEENLGKVKNQMSTLGESLKNVTKFGTFGNGNYSGNFVGTFAGRFTPDKGSNYESGQLPSACNCNCGRKNKFIFG